MVLWPFLNIGIAVITWQSRTIKRSLHTVEILSETGELLVLQENNSSRRALATNLICSKNLTGGRISSDSFTYTLWKNFANISAASKLFSQSTPSSFLTTGVDAAEDIF